MTSTIRMTVFFATLCVPTLGLAQGGPPDDTGAPARVSEPPDEASGDRDAAATPDDTGEVGDAAGQGDRAGALTPVAEVAPLAPVAPVAPAAEPTSSGPTYKASFFTRYELRDEFDSLGASKGRFLEGDALVYRARLGMTLPAMDLGGSLRASAQFTPQASGYWGEGDVTDSALGVHEGYARVMGQKTTVDVGRFVMDYGEALIIGNLDWHQTGRSFQGVRASHGAPGSYRVDGFVTQLAEGRTAGQLEPYGAGDQYFAGVYAMLGPTFSKTMALDVYALSLSFPETDVLVDPNDPAAGTATRDMAMLITLGARVTNKVGALDYRVEAGVQVGSALGAPGADAPSALAYHGDMEVGVTMVDGRLRGSVEGAYASGDDPATADKREGWNQLFPTAHKWLGLADVFGARTNVASGAAHVSYKVAQGMVAKLDCHAFARVQPAAVDGPTGYAGMEIDAQFIRALGKGLNVRGLYGLFAPDADFYAADRTAHYVEIEMRLDI